MPKSNFNQFLDECEEFKKNETPYHYNSNANNKIVFENNQQQHEHHEPVLNANANANYSNSSNIFLSRSVNAFQNRFSANRFHSGNTAVNVNANQHPHPRPFGNSGSGSVNNNVNVNMFKKAGSANEVENVTTNPSSSSNSSVTTVIEINNETFPSLAPPRTLTKGGNSNNDGIPKKFKNFKDAIGASAPEPAVVSPTKKKQIKAVQDLHSFKTNHHCLPPPPLFVKKESEILAKSRIYNHEDDDDDDDGFENDARDYNYGSYKSKLKKKQYLRNDDSDDD